MAAMSSSAPGATTTTTLTPPSSSHGNHGGWKSSYASGYEYDPVQDTDFLNGHETTNGMANGPLSARSGNANYDPFARPDPGDHLPVSKGTKPPLSEVRSGGRSTSRHDSKRSRSPSKRSNSQSTDSDKPAAYEDSNKWIHRDKLAKIESAELQAAGIVLPKPRSQSRPRRERSTEKMNGRRATDASEHQPLPSRKNSTQRSSSAERTPELDVSAWDLRMPEEIAEDPNEYWISSDTLAGHKSQIPVAKQSPAPLPADFLDRNAPVPRKYSGTILPDDEFMLSYSNPRSRSGSVALDAATVSVKRSATEGSPKKANATGSRKPSATSAKSNATPGRPKTRSGGGPTREPSSTTRPTTRSGDLSPRAPEGDPPWMVSAYKPDPRLPPDQQLLPTVAKRLQQEQWEKEGKFGSVYDKEFRPLTNDFEGFQKPPELQKPQVEDKQDEWPLRADALRADAKSPTPSRPGTSSYSTMPRIQDTPMISPLASPRLPISQTNTQTQSLHVTRVPTIPEQPQMSEKEKKKSGGCGCCVVM